MLFLKINIKVIVLKLILLFSKMRFYLGLFLFLILIFPVLAQEPFKLQINYEQSDIPKEPDYSLVESWTALPTIIDMADSLPQKANLIDLQKSATADVFYIYPTIFTYKPEDNYQWNASVDNQTLNEQIDKLAVLNQCTAFNGSCKIYAPRYRQAHYSAFTTSDLVSASKALSLAYSDVKEAFKYYLENYNNGRPIVIASHSQGTLHAKALLKEFFDGKLLQKQLVEAYLIGMPIKENEFESIKPSNDPGDVGGFVTWNTFNKGFYPSYYNAGLNDAICTNPLTWKTDEQYAPKELNSGGIGPNFNFVKNPVDAQVKDGMLWINKPYVRGRMFIKTQIWHKADINLYWMNIRENVALRIANFNNNYGE